MSEQTFIDQSQEIIQLVTFNLGNEEFGIDILNVNEILKMIEITEVPNASYGVEGIVNVRGKVIPVIDTRLKLNIAKEDYNNETRIIVVEIGKKTVGFIVDKVKEVLRISKNILDNPPDLAVSGIESDYITAIGKLEKRLIIILDLKRLVNENDFETV